MLLIQNLRLVWFSGDLTNGDTARLYINLFKEEPERSTSAKQPSPQNPFLETASGVQGGYELELQRQLGRVDLIVQPSEPHTSGIGILPNLIETPNLVSFISNVLDAADWLPVAQRVSAVFSALSPAANLADARAQFSRYISHDFDIPDASDQFLQINRKAILGGYECNRIVQTSAVVFQGVQIAASIAGVTESVVSSSYAHSVTHDLNTVPFSGAFDHAQQLAIFRSLFTEVVRATEVGNINFLKDN